ncbi:hypothetical protein B0H34DRAFT_697557 [Crassisporium funariophilum]|nr:hypothetical protein B0H34DRAFT_697557 [Crassisporium funariophilum]
MLRTLVTSVRSCTLTAQCRRGGNITVRGTHTATDTYASSSHRVGNPFPFPAHHNPTPHQIFHLPRNATESDIKARYFDLVLLYHPDKVGSSASSDVAHARFQAITAAYDKLRKKTPLDGSPLGPGGPFSVDTRYQTTAAWRAMRRRRQELYASGAVDDGKKDKLILVGVVMTVFIVIIQTATTRREALADAVVRTRQLAAHDKRQQQARWEARLSQNELSDSEKK